MYGYYIYYRCPVISDLDYFGLVISDANRWFRTVISDGVRWNIRTPRWFRTVISDGERWIWMPSLIVCYITILVLISLISAGDFGQWFRTVITDGVMYKKTYQSTLLYDYFCSNIGDFGRWFRTVLCIRKPNTAIQTRPQTGLYPLVEKLHHEATAIPLTIRLLSGEKIMYSTFGKYFRQLELFRGLCTTGYN